MFKRFLYLVLIMCFTLTNTSCATLVSGRTQDLPVISSPSGAIVTVENMKQETPATFALDRRKGVYLVKIEKEGYEPVEVTLKKGVNGWVFGNIIFGGLIGLVVDIASGSASKFTPDEVEVTLIKEKLGLTPEEIKNKGILIVKLKEEK